MLAPGSMRSRFDAFGKNILRHTLARALAAPSAGSAPHTTTATRSDGTYALPSDAMALSPRPFAGPMSMIST